MFNIFGGYINHLEEKERIIREIANGKDQEALDVGDYYSWEEIQEMETKLLNEYGIRKDLSFLFFMDKLLWTAFSLIKRPT